MSERGGGARTIANDATFAAVRDRLDLALTHHARAASWSAGGFEHDGSDTAFLLVFDRARLTVDHGTHSLPPRSYAVVTEPARVDGGCGVAISVDGYRGLFQVGGPVESTGRLRYLDGCSDTVLVPPVVRGDPCLNLLHVPPETSQPDHHHPSIRVGLVVDGVGTCVLRHGKRAVMRPGSVFVLRANAAHRFETGPRNYLLLMAWHPDSDTGPTDDDHPMLNRTLRPGTELRVR
jgi:hypothetical protein